MSRYAAAAVRRLIPPRRTEAGRLVFSLKKTGCDGSSDTAGIGFVAGLSSP
jgi:hypothetical protein